MVEVLRLLEDDIRLQTHTHTLSFCRHSRAVWQQVDSSPFELGGVLIYLGLFQRQTSIRSYAMSQLGDSCSRDV